MDGANGAQQGLRAGALARDERTIVLSKAIDRDEAVRVTELLKKLDGQDPKLPIKLMIDSPGGDVDAGLYIYDVMQHVSAPIWTICTMHAYSMAAHLLMAGDKGHRYAYPHSQIMLHPPSGHAEIHGGEDVFFRAFSDIRDTRKRLEALIQASAGDRATTILDLMKNQGELWLGPRMAVDLNIIDDVLVGPKLSQLGAAVATPAAGRPLLALVPPAQRPRSAAPVIPRGGQPGRRRLGPSPAPGSRFRREGPGAVRI